MELGPSYDGNLIGVASGEINEWKTRLFHYGKGGRDLIHPQMLCQNPPPFANEALNRLPGNVREVIKEGRLRVYWLVNSKGGIAMTSDRIQLGMEGVRQRRGTVESYGFDEFGSAAGRIWFDADKRYCTENSVGSWHVREGLHGGRDLHPEVAELIKQKKREDERAIIGIINTVQDPELREILFRIAKDDPEQRLTVGLNGKGLRFAGIATHVTQSKAELFKLFLERSGWKPRLQGLGLLLDPVGRFAVRALSNESQITQ